MIISELIAFAFGISARPPRRVLSQAQRIREVPLHPNQKNETQLKEYYAEKVPPLIAHSHLPCYPDRSWRRFLQLRAGTSAGWLLAPHRNNSTSCSGDCYGTE